MMCMQIMGLPQYFLHETSCRLATALCCMHAAPQMLPEPRRSKRQLQHGSALHINKPLCLVWQTGPDAQSHFCGSRVLRAEEAVANAGMQVPWRYV